MTVVEALSEETKFKLIPKRGENTMCKEQKRKYNRLQKLEVSVARMKKKKSLKNIKQLNNMIRFMLLKVICASA